MSFFFQLPERLYPMTSRDRIFERIKNCPYTSKLSKILSQSPEPNRSDKKPSKKSLRIHKDGKTLRISSHHWKVYDLRMLSKHLHQRNNASIFQHACMSIHGFNIFGTSPNYVLMFDLLTTALFHLLYVDLLLCLMCWCLDLCGLWMLVRQSVDNLCSHIHWSRCEAFSGWCSSNLG